MSNDRLEPFNYHNIAFKRCADVVSLKDLTVCDFLDIIDLWKLVGLGNVGPIYVHFGVFEIGPEFLISVQTGYFSGFPEPWY